MLTHNNNEAHVVANIASDTIQWLKTHHIPYSGLKFGKPFAENGFHIRNGGFFTGSSGGDFIKRLRCIITSNIATSLCTYRCSTRVLPPLSLLAG